MSDDLTRRSAVAAGAVAGAALLLGTFPEEALAQAPKPRTNAELQDAIQKLQDAMAFLSINSPPVGTVMAYAGEWDDTREKSTNWMLCNGRTIKKTDFMELFEALKPDARKYELNESEGTFRLPDLRGMFLRGLDVEGKRDPEGAKRFVGSSQDPSLAKHRHHVKLEGGSHEHIVKFTAATQRNEGGDDTDEDGARNADFNFKVEGDGSHSHDGFTDTDGGSDETRPLNIAVHYIIKVSSTIRPS